MDDGRAFPVPDIYEAAFHMGDAVGPIIVEDVSRSSHDHSNGQVPRPIRAHGKLLFLQREEDSEEAVVLRQRSFPLLVLRIEVMSTRSRSGFSFRGNL